MARIDLHKSLYRLLLDRTGLGETGETFIVDRSALVLSELKWHEDAHLKLRIHAQPALRASHGETGIIEADDYRGKKVLAAYTSIPQTGWGFVAKQDLVEMNEPVRSMIRKILLILAISSAAVYLLAVFVSKSIAMPVVQMRAVAERIEGGDFKARNSIERDDEFGYLAKAFNTMTDSIAANLEVQRNVSEINETIVAAHTVNDFSEEITMQLVIITGSHQGAFFHRNEDNNRFECASSVGCDSERLTPFSADTPEGEIGYALARKDITRIHDIPEDTIFTFRTVAGTAIPREILTIPLVSKDKCLAFISLASFAEYSETVMEILRTSLVNITTAYHNLVAHRRTEQLSIELQASNEELRALNEELQSQSEELLQ